MRDEDGCDGEDVCGSHTSMVDLFVVQDVLDLEGAIKTCDGAPEDQ